MRLFAGFFMVCLLAAAVVRGEDGDVALFPNPPVELKFLPSDNGSDTKAFLPTVFPDRIEFVFNDRTSQDNYLHVDFGALPLASYIPGGYVEITMDLDKPFLRLAASVTIPDAFWPNRKFLELEAPMKTGPQTYRFYFNQMLKEEVAGKDYHLYLFLHDYGGESKGTCKAVLTGLAVKAEVPGWREELTAAYHAQYNLKQYKELGAYYRGKYDQLVDWNSIADNPMLRRTALDGEWQKAYRGDKTWDYAYLTDTSFAAAGSALAGGQAVAVPEPVVEDQPGGHYEYKKTVTLEKRKNERVYLRFDDLADSAEVYVNGHRIGTQSSVRKRHEWVVENGTRHAQLWNKPVSEVVKFQHFERCDIECPLKAEDLPQDDQMMLPIYTGQYAWPCAFDITDQAVHGENTVAVRLYGCPVKGWWIFKHGDDRAYRNIFGILGSVTVLSDATPAIADASQTPGTVDETGMVVRSVRCRINPAYRGQVVRVTYAGENLRGDLEPLEDGAFGAEVLMPANFATQRLRLCALDKRNTPVCERELEIVGSVVELRDGAMFVNGDPYVIRGINAHLGIEFDNDRVETRREWLRTLARYRQCGINTLRLEGCRPEHLRDALTAGMMTMPIYASASCNNSLTALGNLDNPDYEFNTDSHKEMAILLGKQPNVVIWNSGNENWHTPGYDDKTQMDTYLETARQALHRFDPAGRPVTYANLDTFGTAWFFPACQDVLGYNTYQENNIFGAMMKRLHQETGLPLVFTEWGFQFGEKQAIDDRNRDMDAWEEKATEKYRLITQTPGSLGGFLYPYHGELKDERGLRFLQNLMSPFSLRPEGDGLVFTNKDVCPFRNVSIILQSPVDTLSSEYAKEVKPGETMKLPLPQNLPDLGALTVTVEYETHRGLQQRYQRPLASLGDGGE